MEEMFDKISQGYDFWNSIFFMQKRAKNIAIDKLNLFDGAEVLDLGTGTGDLAGLVLKKIPEVQSNRC